MFVKVGVYTGYFASEMITENIRMLEKWVDSSQRRTFKAILLSINNNKKKTKAIHN